MSTLFRSVVYRNNGRVRGTFIYLVLCQEQKAIFVKIGVADEPIKRLRELATGCPLNPEVLAYVELPNRKAAFRVEKLLHAHFLAWRSRGEWFRFAPKDKPQFNAGLREVLDEWNKPSWPMKWTKVNAVALLRNIPVASLQTEATRARRKLRVAAMEEISRYPEICPLPRR